MLLLLVGGGALRALAWPRLSGHIVGRLLPHQTRHPALLQRQVDALHQVLYPIEGRLPELSVGQ
jgi:hypothetical protein